ncbi:MAG: peptidylprolyl isomerase [Pseudomonadota bacterium]
MTSEDETPDGQSARGSQDAARTGSGLADGAAGSAAAAVAALRDKARRGDEAAAPTGRRIVAPSPPTHAPQASASFADAEERAAQDRLAEPKTKKTRRSRRRSRPRFGALRLKWPQVTARLPAAEPAAPGSPVATPDGGTFRRGAVGAPLALMSRATKRGARLLWRVVSAVWSFFGELDAALWRGFKIGAQAIWSVASASVGFLALSIADLIRWLPGPAGRAYTAGAGAAAVIASLWIMDELRNAASETGDPQLIVLPPEEAGNPIVARVAGRFIRLSDVQASFAAAEFISDGENLTAREAFDRGLVRSFVEQRLLARAGHEAGLGRDPEISTRLALARERVLASAFMASRIDAATSPEQVRRLYETQSDLVRLGDEVRARHIVVETEAEANWVIEQLRQGVDFALLARDFSIDPSTKANGGDIGYFTRQMMTPTLAKAAFTTGVGDVAPPFFSQHGWHVLEVMDRRPAPTVRFETVADSIAAFLADQAVDNALREIVDAADVIYFEPPEADAEAAAALATGALTPVEASQAEPARRVDDDPDETEEL